MLTTYVVNIDLDDVVGYGFVYYMVNIDLDDVVGYGFVYYVVNIDLDDVVGYGFVYYVVNIDLDDVVGYGFVMPLFVDMSVLNQEGNRSYAYAFVTFDSLSIGMCNCSDSVVCFFFNCKL
jgi:ABC-type molybdate transport system substrate-binding protein